MALNSGRASWRIDHLAKLTLVLGVLFFWMSWRSITTPGPIWFEGPVAGAMKAIESGRLYQAGAMHEPSYAVLTHTPLSYWLGYLAWIAAPGLGAQRALNVLYTLGCAALIFLIVANRGSRDSSGTAQWAAYIAAASFLLCQPVFSWSQMARSPDSLQTLFALTAIVLTIRGKPSPGRHLAVGASYALAILSKQTALITLAATLIWHHGRRAEWRVVAIRLGAGLLLAAPVIAFLQWQSGGGFWMNTISANLVRYDVAKAVAYILIPLAPFWLWTGLVWRFGSPTSQAAAEDTEPNALVRCWFVVSLATGLAACMKDGSDAMYFFDLSAAASLMLGLALQRMPAPRMAVPVLSAAILFMAVAGDGPYFTRNSAQVAQQGVAVRNRLAVLSGDVLADEAWFPISLGRRWWWNDPFILNEMASQGRWDATPLATRIHRKAFAGILVRNMKIWPAAMRRELAIAYNPGPVYPGPFLTYVLYLPKP